MWVLTYVKPARCSKAGALQRAVRRDVEGVRFAEQPLELEHVEVDRCGPSHALRAKARAALLRIDDVQVHVGLDAEVNLVGRREPERDAAELPQDEDRRTLAVREPALRLVTSPPVLGSRKAGRIDAKRLEVLRGRRVEVVDDQARFRMLHLPHDQRHKRNATSHAAIVARRTRWVSEATRGPPAASSRPPNSQIASRSAEDLPRPRRTRRLPVSAG